MKKISTLFLSLGITSFFHPKGHGAQDLSSFSFCDNSHKRLQQINTFNDEISVNTKKCGESRENMETHLGEAVLILKEINQIGIGCKEEAELIINPFVAKVKEACETYNQLPEPGSLSNKVNKGELQCHYNDLEAELNRLPTQTSLMEEAIDYAARVSQHMGGDSYQKGTLEVDKQYDGECMKAIQSYLSAWKNGVDREVLDAESSPAWQKLGNSRELGGQLEEAQRAADQLFKGLYLPYHSSKEVESIKKRMVASKRIKAIAQHLGKIASGSLHQGGSNQPVSSARPVGIHPTNSMGQALHSTSSTSQADLLRDICSRLDEIKNLLPQILLQKGQLDKRL